MDEPIEGVVETGQIPGMSLEEVVRQYPKQVANTIDRLRAENADLRARVEGLEEYVDGNDLMSDFPTASAMRRELNWQRERVEKAEAKLTALVEGVEGIADGINAAISRTPTADPKIVREFRFIEGELRALVAGEEK